MGKIHVLDTEVSNKIAAGEVVERGASVIKELVENSIDASASLITVEIKNGGNTYMRVSDNGSGMGADDAKLCFLRHATSKIRESSDLDAIYTLGFRGEALSSIGAVAEVSLYTKRAEDKIGVRVTCKGGEIISSDEAGIPNGTSIVVENLFFNTPARRKFLKRDATETGYITDIMTRFVFAHPEISFKLTADGKEKLFSPGDNSLKNAVYTAYGKDYANGTIPIEYEADGIRVTGLIGKGTLARPKRNYQSFFVNKRYVHSGTLTAALENAYKNQIMIGKFPMAVINVETSPSFTDINVHPTKLEVKFADEKAVYDAVYYGVKNALYAIPNVPKIERGDEAGTSAPLRGVKEKRGQLTLADMAEALPKNLTRRAETSAYNPRENHFLESGAPKSDGKDKADKITAEYTASVPRSLSLSSPKRGGKFRAPSAAENVGDVNKQADIEDKSEAGIEDKSEAENKEETVFADEYFEIVGQVFNSFIIAEKGDEMLLVDQHAAHERLKYEELTEEMASRRMTSQMLIEPVIVNLSGSEMSAYRDNKEIFDKMGFESEELDESSVIVRCAPLEAEMGEVEPLFTELVAQSEQFKKELITDKYQRLLYTIACKAAVKANMKMSEQEMEALVRRVLRLKNINTCPHGRPIIITMSKKEIEKEFKRIV